MTAEELADAAEKLRAAAEEAAGEAADRLRGQADQLADLAERDRGADHGRLARHQQRLREIREDVDGRVAELIEEADERINAFRSTLEGV